MRSAITDVLVTSTSVTDEQAALRGHGRAGLDISVAGVDIANQRPRGRRGSCGFYPVRRHRELYLWGDASAFGESSAVLYAIYSLQCLTVGPLVRPLRP